MNKLLSILAISLAAGGAYAQSATSQGSLSSQSGVQAGGGAVSAQSGLSAGTGADTSTAPSVPSRPMRPSTPGSSADTSASTRSSTQVGGSGSAGLGAMGGGLRSDTGGVRTDSSSSASNTTNINVLGGSPAPRTPAPTAHDSARENCPPGLAKKDNGCMPPGQAKKY